MKVEGGGYYLRAVNDGARTVPHLKVIMNFQNTSGPQWRGSIFILQISDTTNIKNMTDFVI